MTRQLLFLFFILISLVSLGEDKWTYPSHYRFGTSNGDTSYYGGEVSIHRIKKGNILYEYYPSGNLQSKGEIRKRRSHQFELHGKCELFFDDSTQTIAVIGNYEKHTRVGTWVYYNKSGGVIQKSYPMFLWDRSDYYNTQGDLIRQVDKISTPDKLETVREVEYVNGKEHIIYNKTLFTKIYLNFIIPYMVVVFFFMFSRIFINSWIYNREEGTDLSPIYIKFGPLTSGNYNHSLRCAFTFWFSNYKPENKKLVRISNAFSVIALTLFFGVIIGLAVSGEL